MTQKRWQLVLSKEADVSWMLSWMTFMGSQGPYVILAPKASESMSFVDVSVGSAAALAGVVQAPELAELGIVGRQSVGKDVVQLRVVDP